MKNFVTLDDIEVFGKKVLLRVDFNVPIKEGKITSAERIKRALVTIKELSEKGAKVIILSHLGRPKGEGYEKEFSLQIVADYLSDLLQKQIPFAKDCIGEEPRLIIDQMNNSDIIMLENVRFHRDETKNVTEFTNELAKLGDIYVSDAFSASHRAHSSTEGLARVLPYATGRLMQAELEALEKALGSPKKPVTAIVGGAKVSTKLDALVNLVKKVDYLVIAGGMSGTFLYALGHSVGTSLCEQDMKDKSLEILKLAAENNCQVMLPVDVVVGKDFSNDTDYIVTKATEIPEDRMILDIGSQTANNIINEIISVSSTIIWNGPVGAFEMSSFAKGTHLLAESISKKTKEGKLISIAGGGDTVAALELFGLSDSITYISTAGGAFLEWMEGKELPGVVALLKKNS